MMKRITISICIAFLGLYQILHASELSIQQGLVVLVDCKDVPEHLRANKLLRVHGLTQDAARIQSLRKTLLAQKAADTVSISSYDGRSLPYVNNLVNLIIAPETTTVPVEEMLRVLVSLGRAIIGGRVVTKPWPKEMDEWSHYLHGADNNAVANDRLIGAPKHMQWLGGPLWSRSHDRLASTSAIASTRGRNYYIMDEGPVQDATLDARWHLAAIDAFNGLPLWKIPMKSWVSHMRRFRSGPVQIARLLIAHEDTVYTTLGLNEPVVAIDGKSGKTLKTYDNTTNVEEILYHQGKLIVVVNRDDVEHAGIMNASYDAKAIKCVDAQSGKETWRWPASDFADIIPTTLAALDQRVFLQCGYDTLALDLTSGNELWHKNTFEDSPVPTTGDDSGKSKKDKSGSDDDGDDNDDDSSIIPKHRPSGWVSNTLVAYKDVVLTADSMSLVALSADDGSKLWEAPARTPFGRTPSIDVLVINDLVWNSPDLNEGRNYKTGEVVKKLDLQKTMVTSGHHHRCYRNRGAGNFIIYGYRGMEFFDTEGSDHSRNNWIRGVCQWGVMPANGLIYAPPHDCGCYLEAMLHGFWAVAPEQASRQIPADFRGQLIKGPAYGKAANGSAAASDWPTYRQNAARGAVSTTTLSSALKEAWSVEIGEDITAPVIADNTVLLACKKNKTVYALDAASGTTRWHYVAGAPVDSPPTVAGQRVLFGSADGSVTCLSLDQGEVMWRFMAAPLPLMAMAQGELESPWPVTGSVLVKNDTVYFTAGRSSYLDGGLFLYGLSIQTGQVQFQYRYHITSPGSLEKEEKEQSQKSGPNIADWKTFAGADHSDAFSMVGNVNDVMVGDSDSVYLRHMRFNDRLEPQKDYRQHLFSSGTLLDPNEAYRSHWFYGTGDFSLVPVSYGWLAKGPKKAIPSFVGGLLVHDGKTLWGMLRDRERRSLVSLSLEDNGRDTTKNYKERKARITLPYAYNVVLPFRVRAMIKAGPALYLGGAQGVGGILGEESGGLLQAFTATDGEKKGSIISLKASPVFDGMAAANHELFISLVDGSLVCLK